MNKLAIVALLAIASPALAQDVTAETVLGTTMEAVRSSLVEMGYEVRKSEMEDGMIEVYFVKNGKMGELYVDTKTGRVSKLDIES